MTRRLAAGFAAFLGAFLALPAPAAAHRLDEYLQATRVSLERNEVRLEIDLTPGVAIADQVLRLVDADRSGSISPEELRAYGERMIADVTLDIDGRAFALRLRKADASTIDELRAGVGVMRLEAETDVARIAFGSRHVRVRNVHEPVPSVYLANALLPGDPGVTVVHQARDVRQQEIRVAYDVAPGLATKLIALVAALAGLAALVAIRRRLSPRVPDAFA